MMRKVILISILLFLIRLIMQFSQHTAIPGSLQELPSADLSVWKIPGALLKHGAGNSYRVVQGPSLPEAHALELSAGPTGRMVYYREVGIADDVYFSLLLHFRSTQGVGRVVLEALDEQKQQIGAITWVITGQFGRDSEKQKYLDLRSSYNYDGQWLHFSEKAAENFRKYLPQINLHKIKKYRLQVEIASGQHVLISSMHIAPSFAQGIDLAFAQPVIQAKLGDKIRLQANVTNNTLDYIPKVDISLLEPYGFGIISESDRIKKITAWLPGETRHVEWTVKAQRPDEVNFSQPWQVKFAINGEIMTATVSVQVMDTRPGKIYYVMTEDLEAIDSAGYGAAWGNANGWLDSEELTIQMIHKAEQLNAIADRYQAKWTHYIAWPLVRAAQWSALQSPSVKWQEFTRAIKRSVQMQTAGGHEYAIHMHSDYDPRLSGNLISYNLQTDGFWGNHLRHGWAHVVSEEGTIDQYNTRAGLLFNYQSELAELSDGGIGQVLSARAGSFDFGNGSKDEAKSIGAYLQAGFFASSDADGNQGGSTSANYGQEIYLAGTDDINKRTSDLKKIGLVVFKPTGLLLDYHSAKKMNKKVDEGVKAYSKAGDILPGVHGIVGFAHAMFFMGDGDWKGLEGGQFAELDDHLAYVKNKYVDSGKITFATASQLVADYLDYYSPTMRAVYRERIAEGFGRSVYRIRLLGNNIPADINHVHKVKVKYPPHLRKEAYKISVCRNGKVINSTWNLPTLQNDIEFDVDDNKAQYTLEIYHSSIIYQTVQFFRKLLY